MPFLERAIAVDPNQPTAHVTLSRIYVHMDRFAEAVTAMR